MKNNVDLKLSVEALEERVAPVPRALALPITAIQETKCLTARSRIRLAAATELHT